MYCAKNIKSFAGAAQIVTTFTLALVVGRASIVLAQVESSNRLSSDLFDLRPQSLPEYLRKQYEEDGFVVVPNLVSKQATSALLKDLEASDMFTPETNILRRTFSSVSKTYMTLSTTFQPFVAKQLVGSQELYHAFDALYIKTPGQEGGNWHRDHPVTRVVQDEDTMIAIWMTLTNTTGGPDGASMVMANGSHKWSLTEGCTGLDHIGGELVHQNWKGYEECMQRLGRVSVPLPPMEPGDAVLFHPELFHKTAASFAADQTRVALSLVAITEKARFRADQTIHACNVKPRALFALEELHIKGGDLLSTMTDAVFPKLDPSNALSGPRTTSRYVHNPEVKKKSLHHMLANVLLGCSAKRLLRIVPNSYEGKRERQGGSPKTFDS
ncbi:expressed unknown protein [Seminavis robusta]|uniref:Phytanoyl-CoA dioxygenase n=1 Tax=Seminavis robusta TaxID=568900 RepID=A0A9N8E914_9STRA|nr:expressed unknown protein [Seminavis robusta]|eukprot:Sro626_g177720.1 n/a (383) ;mRNA; r:8277-9425